MEKTRREIMDRVYLTYLPAKKFKTGCLSAQFITPLRRETASCGALLPLVLQRGTMRCPDIQQLSAAMDQLYGAQINPTIRKRAECQCIGFVASVMDDSFAPGEKSCWSPPPPCWESCCWTPSPVTAGICRSMWTVSGPTCWTASVPSATTSGTGRTCAFAGDVPGRALRRQPPGRRDCRRGHQQPEAPCLQPGNDVRLPAGAVLLRQRSHHPGGGRPAGGLRRPARGAARDPQPPRRVDAPAQPRVIRETMDVTQGRLSMGFRCGTDDVPAMLLANLLFGGTSNSKLFLNVREKLSLCYYASSNYVRSKGILTVSSGIETADYQRALDEILHQLQEIRDGHWEPWELEGPAAPCAAP